MSPRLSSKLHGSRFQYRYAAFGGDDATEAKARRFEQRLVVAALAFLAAGVGHHDGIQVHTWVRVAPRARAFDRQPIGADFSREFSGGPGGVIEQRLPMNEALHPE